MEKQEIKKVLLNQNRIKFFESENHNSFMYDAFSQNIFPINKNVADFFESDNFSEIDNEQIQLLYSKLSQWNDEKKEYSRLPETHLTINFSNKCNLNCSYCYRHKDNKNVMSLDRAFQVLEYADKHFKVNNDEIIFSLDMTAEALLDYDEIVEFDDKLAEYENLYITESDMISISLEDFVKKIGKDLYKTQEPKSINEIILDNKLYSYFDDQNKVSEILEKGNYNPQFLDKKRLLRLNRELLEVFYPDLLKHKDYQQFRIWFMSNGAHMTTKEIDLIKKIRIDPFWISLDGPEEVHDKNRKYYDNKGSFKDVIQNIQLLQKNDINVKISCVVTNDYPYPDKLYAYLKGLNIKAIQMCPIRNGHENSFSLDNVERLIDGYRNLYDLIFNEVKNGNFSAFSLLEGDLSMLTLENLFMRTRQNGRCTWGDEVVLDAKGDMYPCLYVIGQEEYLLGNIDEKKSSRELLKPIKVTEMSKCNTCWARYLCGGTCHYNSIVSGKTVYDPDDIECYIRKSVITESIKFLIRLIENNINLNYVYKAFSGK